MVGVTVLILFLILEGKYSVFIIKYNVGRGFFIDALYQIEEVPLYFKFVES